MISVAFLPSLPLACISTTSLTAHAHTQAIWENQFYYLFGFLFIVASVLVIACSEITIVFVYLQLCAEDYHWWWRSFVLGGSCSIYVFLYSIFYYLNKLSIDDTVATLLYFGYSALMALSVFLATGVCVCVCVCV